MWGRSARERRQLVKDIPPWALYVFMEYLIEKGGKENYREADRMALKINLAFSAPNHWPNKVKMINAMVFFVAQSGISFPKKNIVKNNQYTFDMIDVVAAIEEAVER